MTCNIGGTFTNDGMNLVLNTAFLGTKTIISQGKAGTGTSPATITDTALQTPVGSYKPMDTGYPIADLSNRRMTARFLLTTLDDNGSNLTEAGFFNTDGTPVLAARLVHDVIAKTASIQVAHNLITSLDPT